MTIHSFSLQSTFLGLVLNLIKDGNVYHTEMILLPKSLANITVATDTKPMMTASTLLMIVVCLSDIFGLQGRIKSSIITAADALRMELSVLKNMEKHTSILYFAVQVSSKVCTGSPRMLY